MAGQALSWDSAPSNLKRFNDPIQPFENTTYGFKGFPEMHMMEPKRPLRHQPSADVTTDVNRYFRRDSPTEWMPGPKSPPGPAPAPQWLQAQGSPAPPPAPAPAPVEALGTLSPRYNDEQPSYRKPPVIRDPLRELTSAEKRKKIEEHYMAEEDLAQARRKREDGMAAKRQEQQKADTRKKVFTELQLNKPPETQYADPAKYSTMPRFGDENRDMGRPRENGLGGEMLEQQSMQLRKMQDEINRAQDDMSYRPNVDRPRYDVNPRAQSVSRKPLYLYSALPDHPHTIDFLGLLYALPTEPQTDRAFMRENRDHEIWGQSNGAPDYLNISPRRKAVGQLYNNDSTYKHDFDKPVGRRRQVLGNPNKDPFEPYAPWGAHGGGAPMADSTGQRKTRIQGSMGVLGRELSDSARARRAHKQELLQTIGEQANFERARKDAEKAYARQGFVEVADAMRQQKVGYPKYKPSGLIASHHLPHSMSNPYPAPEVSKQREYHSYLSSQIEEKNRNTRLGQLEEKRQAREHFRTQDGFFGKRGGGNRKGEDLRKFNLDKAIHNPQSTSNYSGGNAPYAEFGSY